MPVLPENRLAGERIEAMKEPVTLCVLCAESFFPGVLRVFDLKALFRRQRAGVAGGAAAGEEAAQIADRGEYFVVPVGALCVARGLFLLDDVLVFPKDVLREPGDERP